LDIARQILELTMGSSDLEDPKKHDAGIIASASIQEIGEEAKTATRNEHDMSFREVMALYPKVSSLSTHCLFWMSVITPIGPFNICYVQRSHRS
jgi:hypothetical protein